jgi:hypothetical protein
MHRRVARAGTRKMTHLKRNYSKSLLNKFLAGSLTLSVEALRVIEDLALSDDDLQTKYTFVDECGRKGISVNNITAYLSHHY